MCPLQPLPIGAGCAETSNNSLPTASTVTLGQTISATICSTGDLDYYTFTGQAGQVIGINVDAQSLGSNLDAVLYLYDSNGRLMEMMDDEVYATIRDPLINYCPAHRWQILFPHPGMESSRSWWGGLFLPGFADWWR